MKKKDLIRITILCALLTQISHAAQVFYLLSNKSTFDLIISWIFAVSLEASIYIFTLYGKKNIAMFFAVISFCINILSYWYSMAFDQAFIGMLLISFVIPVTIYFYSELLKEETKPTLGRPRKEKLEL